MTTTVLRISLVLCVTFALIICHVRIADSGPPGSQVPYQGTGRWIRINPRVWGALQSEGSKTCFEPHRSGMMGDALNDAINACLNMNERTGSLCHNYDAQEACLRGLNPVDVEGQSWVRAAIEFQEKQKNRCPGLNHTETCISFVAVKCVEMLQSSMDVGDQRICYYVPMSRDCLAKANSSYCNTVIDEIEYYSDMVSNISAQCEAGYWDHGPCSPSVVVDCTYEVYSDIKTYRRSDVEYNCRQTDVAKGRSCLEKLRSTCRTEFQQGNIKSAMVKLNLACPVGPPRK